MVLHELDESCRTQTDSHVDSFRTGGAAIGLDHNSHHSYLQSNWAQIAETTMPLRESKLAFAHRGQFLSSIELRSRRLSSRIILVNVVALLVNLALAVLAFYYAFVNNSSATTAFAADCVLDFISSAIVLWRYHGDLSYALMDAREQIACIYLGALFEISGIGIIVKAVGDLSYGGAELALKAEQTAPSYELVYLAAAGTLACSVITYFKCSLYQTIRDNSILLDVINSVISTIFAMSIIMSQMLINVDPVFWYMDPTLSIVLAVFMMAFGVKVIHQNVHVLVPDQQQQQHMSRSYLDIDRNGGPNSIDISTCWAQNRNYGSNS